MNPVFRLLGTAALVCSIALPLHAYHPEWIRTSIVTSGPVNDIFTGDFNGDGRPDVVFRNSAQVFLSLANADRTFAAPVLVHTAVFLSDVLVADATGDGRLDVIVADTGTNNIVVVPSNGDATFGAPISTALPVAPTAIVSGDFNGNGAIDVVLRSFSASVLILLTGDGAGHFAEVWRTAIDASTGLLVAGDIDGDGHQDLLTRISSSLQYDMRFGRGDSTFDAPVNIPASSTPVRVVLADLDEDGDCEILASEFAPPAVRVIVNNGSRTFASATPYSVIAGNVTDSANLTVADVTDDGVPDVVATLLQSKMLATLPGNGNGTLGIPVFAPVPPISPFTSMFPERLAVADFTGDGRTDLAVGGSSKLVMFANAAGDVSITLAAVSPVITVGQKAELDVDLHLPSGFLLRFDDQPPFATGLITLKDGDTPIATGAFQNNHVTIEIPSLAVGTYTLTASFAGDDHYRATTSSAITQTVTTEKTTVVLTSDAGDEAWPFGQSLGVHATVTSPLPGPLSGALWLYTDGQRTAFSQSGPTTHWSLSSLAVGTHELFAEVEGTATQPPSTSEVLRVTIKKATTTTAWSNRNLNHILLFGEQPEVRIDLRTDPFGGTPGGNVSLYDGSTFLATTFADNHCCSGGMTVSFILPVLPPGVHHLRARFEGSDSFEPSESDHERYTILPATGFVIDVYAAMDGTFNTIAAAGFFTLPDDGHFKVFRRVGNGAWTLIDAHAFQPSFFEHNPTPGVVYAFRMEAYDASNTLIASSNADAAMIFSFTDKPIAGGMQIKALHVKELVDATNVFRSAAGLSPLAFSDAGAGKMIRLAHLTTLRSGLNDARAAIGVTPIVFSNDATLGSTVRARQFQELRDAMQ
jgi:hypothetical protein